MPCIRGVWGGPERKCRPSFLAWAACFQVHFRKTLVFYEHIQARLPKIIINAAHVLRLSSNSDYTFMRNKNHMKYVKMQHVLKMTPLPKKYNGVEHKIKVFDTTKAFLRFTFNMKLSLQNVLISKQTKCMNILLKYPATNIFYTCICPNLRLE